MKNNEKLRNSKETYQYKDVLVYVDWERRLLSVEKGASYMIGKPIPKTAPENIILKCLQPSDLWSEGFLFFSQKKIGGLKNEEKMFGLLC